MGREDQFEGVVTESQSGEHSENKLGCRAAPFLGLPRGDLVRFHSTNQPHLLAKLMRFGMRLLLKSIIYDSHNLYGMPLWVSCFVHRP